MKQKSMIPLGKSIALVSLGLSLAAWSQTSVAITNPGFEDPVIATEGGFQTGTPPGWTTFGSANFGVLNPGNSDYTGGAAPEGANVAFVENASGEAGLSQILTTNFLEGADYTLTVAVGNSGIASGFPGYRVQLLAGGIILDEDDNTLAPAESAFVTSTVNYTYVAGDAALVGQPLEIRLVSKAVDITEINFDDVQLTQSLANPVANAGGPYTVSPSSSLELVGSASLPSDSQTITAYDWDLNNDDTFGDVTGETPAAISFSDLQSVHGMALGPNTIQLRVTDSSSATSTTTATVNLLLADVTPGFDFFTDAGQDDGLNDRWEDLVGTSNLELLLDEDPAVTHVAASTGTFLTHAYNFPGGSTGNVAGALLVDVAGTTGRSFALAGWNTQPVSMEMWFKPDNLTPTPANGQILFEDGGGTGMGLFLANNQLQFRKASGGGLLAYNLATDPQGLLLGPATDEFIQAVFTYNTATGVMQLYVNGTFVGTATPGGGSWSGGDAAAFGTLGGSNVGGLGSLQQNTESFDGQIAQIRVYSNQILTAQEVENNFLAVRGPDTDPPLIVSLDPADETTGLYPGISLSATFDEDVQLTGTGSVTLKNLTAATEQVINLPDAQVSLSGRDLIIDPASNLAFNSTFAVRISGDAIEDFSGNAFAGINDDTTWNFSTIEQNLNPPVIVTKSPQDDAVGVSIGTNIVATFDQNLLLGTGDIVIKDLFDDSTTQTISVTDSSQVTLVDNVLTVNPAAALEGGRAYSVRIASTAVKNFSDVNFAGTANDTEWNFATANLVSQLGILDLIANGGINPGTNEPWKAADRYHLIYVTTALTDATSTDIATYNAFVQADAASQTGDFANMGDVNWTALGSTATVSAFANNPITGPVMAVHNSGTVATGSADLWDFLWSGPNHIGQIDGTDKNIWTGTNTGGFSHGSNPLGATNVRRHWTGWTNWGPAFATEAGVNLREMVGISEALFVIDLEDSVNPELVSITDNVGGGPVSMDDEPVITYTVTFNEAILPSTVDASDFGNVGSAGFIINSVVQQEDPAVFLVTVTPTSAGMLQLRINQSAVLTDLNGNPLDTSAALPDDTIIEVTTATATDYDVWAASFPGLTDSDPALDFDGGGLATGLEWVLGGDPTDPSDDASIAPTFDNTSDLDFFIFTYRRTDEAAADANTTIKAEYGSDLVGWTEAVAGADIVITPSDDGAGLGIDLVEVKIRRTLAVNGKLFVRLNVVVAIP